VSRRPPLRDLGRVRRTLGREVDYVLGGELGGLANPTVIKDGRTGKILRGP
jgi:tRNA A37 threonylcarbamoyladenosine synthetase subunit TsaC/SUA5/YrdC